MSGKVQKRIRRRARRLVLIPMPRPSFWSVWFRRIFGYREGFEQRRYRHGGYDHAVRFIKTNLRQHRHEI